MSTKDSFGFNGGDQKEGGEEDEIEVTAKEVYEKLVEAWLNEKFSPELFETRIELVECMLNQVKELEVSLPSKDKSLSTSLQKIELERVKFVIASFLRERLKKIEENVEHVLEEEADTTIPSKLSEDELNFAKSFADNMQIHFNTLALQQMPSNMQSLDQKKNVPRPNLDEYVFVRVNENVDQVLLDPEEDPSDLEAGSQHIVRYRTVAALVESGVVSLI